MKSWLSLSALWCIGSACLAQEFKITAIERDGTIRWEGLGEHVYTLESRDGFTAPWGVVAPEGQWPIPATEWLVNGGTGWPAEGQRFYRVMAEPLSAPPEGMVRIPGGTFTMGDSFGEGWSDELPLHPVTVSAFYMGETEVTKAEWDDVYGWAVTHGYDFAMPGAGKASDHPVQDIEWYDIVKWCNARSEREGSTPCYYTSAAKTTVYRSGRVDIQNDWVRWDANGYRLPTEAEWEYAARGAAAGRRFPWSDADTITHSRANYYSYWESGHPYYPYDVNPTEGYHPDYDTGGYPYTSPVRSFAPNGYGLYDMAGNVWEWCWDWYAGYSSSPATDPRGPASGQYRVIRGGSWDYLAVLCRVAYRFNFWPDLDGILLGFRLVRTAH